MTAVLTSGRQVDVLVGPAWAGKTRTLRAVHAGWEAAHGLASVVGLAPSASAAAELATAVGIACDTVAKWQHEASKAKRTSGSGPSNDGGEWRLQPGQLVIVDEASLAGTLHPRPARRPDPGSRGEAAPGRGPPPARCGRRRPYCWAARMVGSRALGR
jgi:AAA domain